MDLDEDVTIPEDEQLDAVDAPDEESDLGDPGHNDPRYCAG